MDTSTKEPKPLFQIEPSKKFQSADHGPISKSGRVVFDQARGVITINIEYPYEFEVDRLTEPATVLDFILQVSGKEWASNRIVGELVRMIDYVCNIKLNRSAQLAFCPGGNTRVLCWLKQTITDSKVVPVNKVGSVEPFKKREPMRW